MKTYKQDWKDFTVIPNEIFRNNLSLKAIGLYAYIVSKPDGWDFSIKGTATQLKDGVDSIRSAVVDLEKVGFLVRKQERKSDGSYGENIWYIYDKTSEKPMSEKPTSENPTQVNTNKVNTKKEKIKEKKPRLQTGAAIAHPTNKKTKPVQRKNLLKGKKSLDFDQLRALLTNQQVEEFSKKYQVKPKDVISVWETMLYSRIANGKPYKNWVLALHNWLKPMIEDGRIKQIKSWEEKILEENPDAKIF